MRGPPGPDRPGLRVGPGSSPIPPRAARPHDAGMNMNATRSAGLVRSRTDRKLGGVAGGLAVTAGLDPTLVRVAMAVGAFTGWGILIYLIAWAVMPEEDAVEGRTL